MSKLGSYVCLCILFVDFIPAAKQSERVLKKKLFRVYINPKYFGLRRTEAKWKKNARRNERTKERHVSGQEMRFFGGRVVRFKKAEKTDVLGRSE